jgi:hypothetical protein
MTFLVNSSFEGTKDQPGGWTRDTHNGVEYGEIFVPIGWTAFWREGDYRRPEMKVIPKQAPFLDPARIHKGNWSFQAFTFYGRMDAGLYQVVTGLTPGTQYEFAVQAHAWSMTPGLPNCDDAHCSAGVGCGPVYLLPSDVPPLSEEPNKDPISDAIGNFIFTVGVGFEDPDPYGNNVDWCAGCLSYNAYHAVPPIRFTAPANGRATVYIRAVSLWKFRTSDIYLDDATLTQIGDEPPPTYDCVTLVLPQDATQEQLGEILRLAYPKRRSFMFSHDDAGRLGGLAQLYNILSVDKQRYLDWYSARYPLTTVEFTYTSDWDEEPPPPPPPLPTPIFISFQQQRAAEYRDEFISRVQPPAWLLIGGFEEARHLKSLAPNMEIAIRHVDNDWKSYVMASDKDAAAERWLRHHGQTLFDQADCIDWVFDLNEYIATNDYEALRATPSWIEALVERFAREGWPARIVGLNVPVGNPQHNYICDEQGIPRQIPLLTPAVRLLTDNDCLTAYHSYWGIHRLSDGQYYSTLDQPVSMRMHYAFRALLSWDPVFTQAGVYPKYALSEGGPIYINERGVMVSSGAGWKYRETFNGDVDACVVSYMQFQSLVQKWNAKHGNRARWLTGFLHGGFTEWRHFDMAGEPSRKLADALTT